MVLEKKFLFEVVELVSRGVALVGRTDEWVDGWVDGRMDGWTDGRTDGRIDGWMDEWRKGWDLVTDD